jgi:predicted HNH restriction endonuclease
MEVHHIIPFRHFGIEGYLAANALENLVSLCRACHMLREATRDTLFK